MNLIQTSFNLKSTTSHFTYRRNIIILRIQKDSFHTIEKSKKKKEEKKNKCFQHPLKEMHLAYLSRFFLEFFCVYITQSSVYKLYNYIISEHPLFSDILRFLSPRYAFQCMEPNHASSICKVTYPLGNTSYSPQLSNRRPTATHDPVRS